MNGTSSSWTWTLERTICSDPGKGVGMINEILNHLSEHEWGNKDCFAIHMAMEEAIMNAIKHGNGRDPNKCVKIQVGTTPNTFWSRVEDEGTGFNPEDVPDPTLEENIEKTCGRGVMLMRTYMDEVCYDERGNVVEMWKQRTGN